MRRGTIRRAAVLLLVAAILLGMSAPPSVAKKKRKVRTVEANYVGGANGGATGVNTPCAMECARFEIKPGERHVSLEIQDTLGQPVYASVFVYGYTDGGDTHEHVCAKTETALPLKPGLKELVVVVETAGGANAGCPGPPTEGAIVATFSNLP